MTSLSGLTLGALNAVVTTNSLSSGAPVQVATVVAPAPGTLDLPFNPNITGGGNSVMATAVLPDGRMIIGGSFTTVGGAAHANVARLNADGSVDATFTASTNGNVLSVAVQEDGRLVLGGSFTSVNGSAVSANGVNRIARLNADGTLDTAFNAGLGGANNEVVSVAVQADGKLVLGGVFTSVNGSAVSATGVNRIARLNADGTRDTAFNAGLGGANSVVNSVALQADGKLVLGGNFTSVNGSAINATTGVNYVARLNADGTRDTAFNAGLGGANGTVRSVAVQADGKLLLGGVFTSMNGTTRNFMARLTNDAATQSLAASSTAQVTWTRGGSSPELSQVTLELSTNGGSTWTPLGAGTRVGSTPNWQLTGLSLPTSGHVRARGRTTGGYLNGSSGLIEQVVAFSGLTTPAPSITLSTANLLSNATTLTITGANFSTTPANNTVAFSPAGTGTVTASTSTTLTVTGITGLTVGALNAIVTTNGQASTSAQVATVVTPDPTVTLTTTTVNANAATLTITGTNFDAATPSNNTVALTPVGTGTVTAATATSLTVSVSGLRAGALSAVVTTNSLSSGAPVQVATVRPGITPSTTIISPTAQTLTINGFGFDPTASNNTIAFSPAGTGTVSTATATTLTITGISGLNLGLLNAIVTSNGQASTSTQVANVFLLPAVSVALSGTPAPGIPGATFNYFGDLSLNESGHTVLYGRVSGIGITTANDAGVWINDGSGFSLMLREGGSTGTSGQTIAEPIRFGRITDTGITHVMSGIAGALSTANAAGWVDNGTSFTSFYRKGTTFSNAFNGVSQQIAANDGYFAAQLKLVTGSVTAANDTGIWKIASNGTTTVAAREGQLAAGSTTLRVGNLMSRVAVSSTGFGTYPAFLTAVAPSVLPSVQNRAIFKQNFASAGEPVIAAQSHVTTVPGVSGAQFNTFQSESINATGNVAFGALLTNGVAGVTTANDFGLWRQGTSGLELALLEGQAVPNRSSITFKTVITHWLLDDGSLVFHGTTSANDQGLWHINTSGIITQLLGLGQAIPQAGNATFSAFYLRPDVSPSGKFAAAGTLTIGSAGTTASTNRLLLIGDVTTPGVFSHAIRSGNTYSVNGTTRTVRNLYLGFTTGNEATPTGGTGGMSRVITNNGRDAIWLQFADGTFGHFVTDGGTLPPVAPAGTDGGDKTFFN